MKTFTAVASLIACAAIATAAPSPAPEAGPHGDRVLVNKNKDGVALQGYDPVAYFTEGRPVKGELRYSASFEGARYLFASLEHLRVFEAEPARYAPAFGGYCGYAASINRLSPVSPEWFQVLEGRLVLQHNKKAFDLWNKSLEDNLHKADTNWPGLVAKNGSGLNALLLLDQHGVALEGFDPVSYFAEGRPKKGEASIEATYGGALYHFSSQAHREVFERNPAMYIPAYGGYCGYAASIGKVRPADPLIWSIVDGRLVVQHTKGAAELWARDVAGNKARADRLWPRLVEAKAGRKNPVDSLLGGSVLKDIE